jgi:hypothetical protein
VYIPVVQKEIKWSKRTKDKSLIGTVKEVIPQISHSKKWPMRMQGERDGRTVTLNSYSFLQDRYYEHMRATGFDGFERGERGSTAEHLSDLEYKTKKESERLADKSEQLAATNVELATANEQISEANNQLADLNKSVQAVKGKVLTQQQIEQIPIKISRPMLGGEDTVTMPKKDWENIKKTALAQARSDEEHKAALNQITALKNENTSLKKEKSMWRKKYNDLEAGTKENFMERASRDAELHNLKNAVAKIPADVWNMYTNPKVQQKLHQRNHGQGVL